jgi:hypothetical protein
LYSHGVNTGVRKSLILAGENPYRDSDTLGSWS